MAAVHARGGPRTAAAAGRGGRQQHGRAAPRRHAADGGVPPGGDRDLGCRDHGRQPGRRLLGRPDAASTPRPRRLPARSRPPRHDLRRAGPGHRRRAPLPLARPHARRRPALHAQGRRPALPGSDGGAQTQRLPLPLDGRPGLARTDRAVPEADRDRVLAGAHEIRPPCLTALGRQAPRRLLHPGRHPRDRRLRRRAAYHRGPGNRRTGTLAGRHRRVSGTRQHRRHRHQLPLRLGHLGDQPQRTDPH